jgi:redox-sensitive bicupin YhaK (pirin superfamily)
MFTIRRSEARGHADHGWLDSFHSFSFADYYDPKHVHFGALRVINEDRIAAGQGFPPHPHRDMEIVTYVLEGALAHRDSLGNGSTIRPGDVQRMSAGTGIRHSEFNASATDTLHLLQIWLMPNVTGIPPGYEEQHVAPADKRGRLRVVAAPDGRDGAVKIHADATLLAGLFDGDEAADYTVAPGHKIYLHVARGALTVNGERLLAGDAAMVEDIALLHLTDGEAAEVLLFDLF